MINMISLYQPEHGWLAV